MSLMVRNSIWLPVKIGSGVVESFLVHLFVERKGGSEKGADLFLCFVKGGHAYFSGLVTATELDK